MACSAISTISTAADFFFWPTTCSYYFWLIILGTIFAIVSWAMYRAEESRKGEGDMISSMGVTALAIIFIALIGTLIEGSQGIPVIQDDIFMIILAIGIPIILTWLFKKDQ